MDINKYTEKAQAAILAAQQLADREGHPEILPEHLLVALKDMWTALPEIRAVPRTAQQVQLLQRVVTMCIKEYYSE